jgi:hypothetical protein
MNEKIKRRATDPVPGTKGPARGNNDAFKLDRELEPQKKEPPSSSYEGTLGKRRRETIDSIVDTASRGEKPRPFKKGGAIRGWGKARCK